MSFFGELKRRNVFRVGVAYLLAAWVLLQIVDFMLDTIAAPNWIMQVFVLAAAVGLPVVLVFSWVFEMTPEGVKRESAIDRNQSITPHTGSKLDRVIIGFLAAAVVLLLTDRLINTDPVGGRSAAESTVPETDISAVERPPTDNGSDPVSSSSTKSIAVLPFLALSSGPDDEYFADGLTEEILNSLAQLPELLVTARTSSFHFKGQDISIQEIAAQLGVGTIVEGSVRRSGDRLRVTAQLIRAADGFHLWSENYDSTSDDTIAVQEDIAEQIATAMNVVLDENKREAMRRSGLRNVEAFIAMQKGNELMEKAHGDPDMINLLRQANMYFEQVQERVPTYPVAYQTHSDLYSHQLMNGASGDPDGVTEAAEVEEALAHARADGEAAVSNARTPAERHNSEMDLAFLTGDWQGMTARIERFAGESGCNEPNWYANVTIPFGYAQKVLPRAEEFSDCDPFASSTWRTLVRMELWAGNPETALHIARKGSERAAGDWLSMQLISAEVALGQFDQAEAEIGVRLQAEENIRTAHMLVAAARGDRAAVDRLLEQHHQDPNASDAWALVYAGWSGDREAANENAARIDGHVLGSPALTTVLIWCQCGAPWDLSATPNLAADLEAGGLTWPPNSPIHFPLKDW